ncbi:MAG: glycosyltransferase family 2 protein [Chloroflexi bacterium]|nr:glycosyltransferase family 2 protein [Chloroflexota bacterium]
MATITFAVIAKNEERQIADCLACAGWADEILVVDANSADRTVELAQRYTERVYRREFMSFAHQRNHALDLARCEWVLFVDADERVTPELAAEIRRVMDEKGPVHHGPRDGLLRRDILLRKDRSFTRPHTKQVKDRQETRRLARGGSALPAGESHGEQVSLPLEQGESERSPLPLGEGKGEGGPGSSAQSISSGISSHVTSPVEPIAGYWIPRKDIIWGKWIRHGGWYPDYQLRLLRRGKARYDECRKVHEVVRLDGEAGYLAIPFVHYNYDNVRQFLAKQELYSTFEARILHERGVRARPHNFVLQPLRALKRRYLDLGGFRDGGHGLLLSILLAYYEFVTYRKLRGLGREE